LTVIALTKSTFRTTVQLTLKTKSTLTSTLQTTLRLIQRRKPADRRGAKLMGHLTVLKPFLPGKGRNPAGFAPVLAGTQEIRLAKSAIEVDAAQALRYRVFYGEMGAKPLPGMAEMQRDFDHYDQHCDHLLVLDHKNQGEVVGTYRVLRREHAKRTRGFYTASEYDISRLTARPDTLMELGRSCVDERYRDRATMQLLWRGIAEYVNTYGVEIMFGCASLPGTDPEKLKVQLSYLYHYHLAPEQLRTRALPDRFTEMNLLPKDAFDAKRALASLPPLLKGYLRVGAFVGDGAVIDHQFNTTDVCIIVKTDMMAERYTRHYEIGAREDAGALRKAS
jgi:putative hemolysin